MSSTRPSDKEAAPRGRHSDTSGAAARRDAARATVISGRGLTNPPRPAVSRVLEDRPLRLDSGPLRRPGGAPRASPRGPDRRDRPHVPGARLGVEPRGRDGAVRPRRTTASGRAPPRPGRSAHHRDSRRPEGGPRVRPARSGPAARPARGRARARAAGALPRRRRARRAGRRAGRAPVSGRSRSRRSRYRARPRPRGSGCRPRRPPTSTTRRARPARRKASSTLTGTCSTTSCVTRTASGSARTTG